MARRAAGRAVIAVSSNRLLVIVIVLQQGLIALAWLGCARLNMAPRAALHWALAAFMLALGGSVVMLRPSLDPLVGRLVPNAAILLAALIIRRGVQHFLRLAPSDREHSALAVLALGSATIIALLVSPDHRAIVVITSAAMAYTILRAAAEVYRCMSPEIGARAAALCAAALGVNGVALAIRAVATLAGTLPVGQASGNPAASATAPSIVMGLTFVASGLLLAFALGSMVVLRVVTELRHLSLHDALTQLLNRRGFERALEAEIQRHARMGQGYALVAVDIDHFKRVNDRYGHATGDAALVSVAHALKNSARAVDSVARVGGEEFCVLLPGVDLAGARRGAERLWQAVRGQVHDCGGERLRITVSVGVASAVSAREDPRDLRRRLDTALYEAKSRGRDCIVESATALAAH